MMTFLPLEQIDEMDKWEGSKLNTAKEILASELTTLVHGSDEAKKAKAGAEALFSAATPGSMENVPTATLSDEDFSEEDTVDILTILVKAGLEKSRGDARRDVNQGGVTVDGEKVTDFKAVFSKDDLKDGKLVKRGKKSFKLVKY